MEPDLLIVAFAMRQAQKETGRDTAALAVLMAQHDLTGRPAAVSRKLFSVPGDVNPSSSPLPLHPAP